MREGQTGDQPSSGEGLADQAGDVLEHARDLAQDTGDHPIVRAAARVGYVASGLIHALIGWAALGIAWLPLRHGSADQSGALANLASQPWGRPLLWCLVAGLAGLALWQLSEAVGGWHGRGRDAVFSRLKALGKTIAYVALGLTTMTFARGRTADSRSQSAEATETLLATTGGRALVTLAGLAVIGIGAYHVLKGWRKRFLRDLVDDPGPVAEVAGRYGYMAKGFALAIVGVLLIVSAVRESSEASQGLDGAFRAIAATPFGTALLTVSAVGFVAYGVYSFFRARYTKL